MFDSEHVVYEGGHKFLMFHKTCVGTIMKINATDSSSNDQNIHLFLDIWNWNLSVRTDKRAE